MSAQSQVWQLKATLLTAEPRPDPRWNENAPICDERCRYHDGKRCELQGMRAHEGLPCEPVVQSMGKLLQGATWPPEDGT